MKGVRHLVVEIKGHAECSHERGVWEYFMQKIYNWVDNDPPRNKQAVVRLRMQYPYMREYIEVAPRK